MGQNQISMEYFHDPLPYSAVGRRAPAATTATPVATAGAGAVDYAPKCCHRRPLFLLGLSLLGLSLPVLARADFPDSPLVDLGESGVVKFVGSSRVNWHSNIFRDERDEESDITYSLAPGFEWTLGRGLSVWDAALKASYTWIEYMDNPDLGTELLSCSANSSYQGSRLDLEMGASYQEQQTTSGDVNRDKDLIESRNHAVRLNFDYRYSPKLGVSAGIRYAAREYVEPEGFFADYDHWRLPFDLYYEWTPKLDLSLGYQYGLREVKGYTRENGNRIGSYDTHSHFFNAGLRGALLPKLVGSVRAGFRMRDSDSSTNLINGSPVVRERDGSGGMLGLDADLNWAQTAKTSHRLRLTRDFGVAGEGDVTEVTALNVSSSYVLTTHWTVSTALGFTYRDYQDRAERHDGQADLGLNLTYRPDAHWRLTGGYRYVENDSNTSGYSYEDHQVRLGVSLRY